MKITTQGLAIIKDHEQLRLKAYSDAGYGWARATIGWGHTGPDVSKGMEITKAKALALLKKDVEWVEKAVNEMVTVSLTQAQFDALCSFVFNVGAGGPNTSGGFYNSTLRRKLNAGDYAGAANEFPKWRKSNGKVMAGLIRRRAQEKALFLSGKEVYNDNAPVEVDTGTPMPQSTSVWTELVTTITGSFGAVVGLGKEQPILAAFIVAILVAGAIYIIRERKRHAMEGMV